MIPPCSEANAQCANAAAKTTKHAHTLIGPGQKAWNVHKCHKRNVEGVAESNKTRALDGRVNVETASKGVGLVANNPNSSPLQAAEANDDVLGIVWHDLKELVVVHNLRVA